MTKINLQDTYNKAEKEFNLGKGEYFKVKEGDNKVRLVSELLPHPGEYKGTSTFKWLCQVMDLSDGKVKPYFMPNKVYKDIVSLQMDEDYAFDEVPMPYNINIKAENAGKMEVKYSVIPSPKRVELTVEELKKIEAAPTVQEVQQKIWENEKNPAASPESQDLDNIAKAIPF